MSCGDQGIQFKTDLICDPFQVVHISGGGSIRILVDYGAKEMVFFDSKKLKSGVAH